MKSYFQSIFLSVLALYAGNCLPADRELLSASKALQSGGLSEAVTQAREAIKLEPQSRLAHWIQAQSLLSLSGKPLLLGDADKDLLEEAKVRLDTTPQNMLPKNLLVMPKSAEGKLPIILVDAERSRLYVFRSKNGIPQLVEEFYTTIGAMGVDKQTEGDQKTPLGIYQILFEVREPRKDGFLGRLALTLDYPNALDKLNGRTGDGIWIHGVPKSLHVRPPKASDGCLALSNKDLARLKRYIRLQESQIVIVPKVEWLTHERWSEQARTIRERLKDQLDQRFEGGIFYVSEFWPWVLTHHQENGMLIARDYFEIKWPSRPKKILSEKL